VRRHGLPRSARLLPLAVMAAAILAFSTGCDRPEPPADDRPAVSRVVPPGGEVPPPGSPAELARPKPLPEQPPAAVPPAAIPPAAVLPAAVPPVWDLPTNERAPETGAAVPAPPPVPGVPYRAEVAEEETETAEETPPPSPTVDAPKREASPAGGTAGAAGTDPPARKEPAARTTARKPPSAGATPAARVAAPAEIPIWARDGEELSYKVTFMGVTAGYARLISKGKVRIGERDAYHILIKAWTTGTLSVLFPISESFDYYLDTETLVPLRRDSVIRKVNRPEIVLFDQEKGVVTHWYGDTMEVRKKKQVGPPGFYDGVGATYFFRSRGFGDRSVSIRVFGGRKVYRVGTERAGEESIPYGNGKVDTFLVKPIYREEGGGGGKPMVGELLVWVSKDPRRVPVKLYASFTKGLEWKLVGELTSGLQ